MVRIVPYTQQTQTPNATPLPAARAVAPTSAIGDALQNVGQAGMVLSRALEQKQEADDRAWTLSAQNEAERAWMDRYAQLKMDAPSDARDFKARALSEFDKFATEKAGAAPSEGARLRFRQWADSYKTNLDGDALQFEARQGVAHRKGLIEQGIQDAANLAIKDPESAKGRIAGIEAQIDEIPNIPAPTRDALKKSAREQIASAHYTGLIQLDPERVYGEMSGLGGAVRYLQPLKSSESNGQNIPNQAGTSSAFGPYQFTKGTWESLIKKHPQLGLTEADRFDPVKQERAVVAFTKDNLEALKAAGVTPTDKALKVAHFLGAGGGIRFMKGVESDPSQPSTALADADQVAANRPVFFKPDGTQRTAAEMFQYLTGRFANTNHFEQAVNGAGQANGFDMNLTPERRVALMNAANSRMRERDGEWAADFDVRLQNASSAAVNTGTLPQNAPTEAEFVQRYGPVQGAQKAAELETQVQLGQNIQKVAQMGDGEAQALLAANKPAPDDPQFATKQKAFEVLSRAYAADREMRNKDPAGYVQRAFPELGRAWQSVDQSDPAAMQALLTRTDALQQQLGMSRDQRMLLPDAVAARAVEVFKNETVSQDQRLGAVAGLVMATRDPDQQRRIFAQLEKEGIPGRFRGVLDAQLRGDVGAARRLAAAAMADPEKLKALDPKVAGSAIVEQKIREQVFQPGQIGDAVYGLSAGRSENGKRATDDMELLRAYVRLEALNNGGDVDGAVKKGVRDLYGDVQVYEASNAVLALPPSEDRRTVGNGLSALETNVRQALDARIPAAPADTASARDKEAHRLAKLQVERSNRDLIANGEWRSFGDGVAFIDKATGLAVSGRDGKPLVYTLDQVKAAAGGRMPDPVVDIMSGVSP